MKFPIALLIAVLSTSSAVQALPWIEKVYQNLGENLEVSAGGQVFKAVRREPALNAFGKADMFGRADDRGSMEVRYRGLSRDGKVVLRIIEEDPKAKADRTPQGTGPLPAGVAALSRNTAIPLDGQSGMAEALPAHTTEVALDLSRNRNFRFGSVVVAISQADPSSLKYSLRQVLK